MKRVLINVLLCLAGLAFGGVATKVMAQVAPELRPAAASLASPPAPDWAKDLVIYEIATKAFTSPNGPESGTFESLRQKLPYLQDLGITGIWLSGHSVSDPKHFYNIWTQYAVVEPDRIDPSLGTTAQFKALIDDAHHRGIKVFLDVITHGVMPSSSVYQQHPEWFRAGSWGMVDYDWQGGHTGLDDWWVKTWTDAVTQYGIDGFRLDVAIYRPDLWARIRQNAAAAGHPIVIFNETLPVIPGVTDFTQKTEPIRNADTGKLNEIIANDLPAFYRKSAAPDSAIYRVDVEYLDGSKAFGVTDGSGTLHVSHRGFTADRQNFTAQRPLGLSELGLSINNAADRAIRKITVSEIGGDARIWSSDNFITMTQKVDFGGRAPQISLWISPFFSDSPSIQLSCHDYGWQGYPTDQNPYGARGSRASFGYSVLFNPKIPIFMSGDEFDAEYRPLPTLSPDLFGGRNPGTGKWLYGSMLDWSQLEQPRHSAMFRDVRRMLALRKQEAEILTPDLRGEIAPPLAAVSFTSDIAVPVPYIRWNGRAAIIVAANRDDARDAHMTLNMPVDYISSSIDARFLVTDLWNGSVPKIMSREDLMSYRLIVKKDLAEGGGISLIKLEVVE